MGLVGRFCLLAGFTIISFKSYLLTYALGFKTVGCALRLRAWVGVVVALDVAAVVFQWVFYVAGVIDGKENISTSMTDIKYVVVSIAE